MKLTTLLLAGAAAIVPVLSSAALADSYGFSSNGLSFPFAAAVAKGFADAAKEGGDQAIVLDSKGDVLKQTNGIDDLIAQGVKGIAIMPNDSAVATAWVDKAVAAGIPVVASASMIGDTKTRPIDKVYENLTGLVTQQEVAAGHQVGILAAKLLKAKGVSDAKVAVIEGAAGYAEVAQRTQGFEEGMKEAGQAYKIVAAQPGDWTAEKGESVCQNILQSNPDIDLFFNQADDMVVGCSRAVKNGGSKAILVGFGGSKLAIQAIKDGTVDGTVCYKPEEIGRISYKLLHDTVSGVNTKKEQFVTYPTPGVSADNIGDCQGQW